MIKCKKGKWKEKKKKYVQKVQESLDTGPERKAGSH